MSTKLAVRVYPTGMSCSVRSDHQRIAGKRSESIGWSDSSTRANMKFLMSVEPESLAGIGYAVTLTVRDVPPSPEEYAKIRNKYFHRLRRMGATRCHWVIEWTKNRRPHMHLAIYFPEVTYNQPESILYHWIQVTGHLRTLLRGQHIALITDHTGWSQYVSKHASRGAKHYQRNPNAKPDGWKKSGRMWGKFGDWFVSQFDLEFDQSCGYFQFRRWNQKLRHANHRMKFIRSKAKHQDRKTIKSMRAQMYSARNVLRITDANAFREIGKNSDDSNVSPHEISKTKKRLSAIRGMSEWVDQSLTHRMLVQLANQGMTCSII